MFSTATIPERLSKSFKKGDQSVLQSGLAPQIIIFDQVEIGFNNFYQMQIKSNESESLINMFQLTRGLKQIFSHGYFIIRLSIDLMFLRGYCTPNLKLVCFMHYLKIINSFRKNNACTLKKIVHGTQKWH